VSGDIALRCPRPCNAAGAPDCIRALNWVRCVAERSAASAARHPTCERTQLRRDEKLGLVKVPYVCENWRVQVSTNNKYIVKLHDFLSLHWRRLLRIRERVRFSEEAFHLFLAGGVGVLGGLVNVFYYYAMESVKEFFLRRPGDPVEIAEMMNAWGRLITPTVGGLLAGLILYLGLKLVGPQSSTNMLEVIVAGDGRLPLRTGLVKFISSLVSIGTGGSIGREGGIVQLSATLASKIGQLSKWPPYRLRLLVGCGAASGIAAAYNAPIAGAVFAALLRTAPGRRSTQNLPRW